MEKNFKEGMYIEKLYEIFSEKMDLHFGDDFTQFFVDSNFFC